MAKFYKILPLYILTFLLLSCQEGGDAGDLLGQWRMSDSRYVSFSGSIVQFHTVDNNVMSSQIFGNFHHVGDSIFIDCHSIHDNSQHDKDVIENVFGFKPFNNIRVKIESLTSDHLQLSKDGQYWLLEKW